MHMGEHLKRECGEEKPYVFIAGHDGSDSIGMNLILDELQKEGLKSYACSGFARYTRL